MRACARPRSTWAGDPVNREQSIAMSASSLMGGVTLHVKIHGQRALMVRVWLAGKLLALAARVAGCYLEVEMVVPEPMEQPEP